MRSFLDTYGLPRAFSQDPFSALPPSARQRPLDMTPLRFPESRQEPMLPPPEVRRSDIEEMGDRALEEMSKPKQDPRVAAALAEAERAMRGLPPLPSREDYQASYVGAPLRRRAMTPLEGPDTGEENPNADAPSVGYFRKLRGAESANDPGAVNPITKASGLYQFLPSTFHGIRKEAPHLGLTEDGIFDPKQQETAVQYYTQKSMRQLVPALGRTPTAGELYALHFLGHGGGMNFISNLDRPVGETVSPAAIDANPWLRPYVNKPGRALLGRLESMMA